MGDRSNFGGSGAMLENSTQLLGLPVTRNLGTASRFEDSQITAWAHLARKRGDLRLAREELALVSRDRLQQRVEFTDLAEADRQCV